MFLKALGESFDSSRRYEVYRILNLTYKSSKNNELILTPYVVGYFILFAYSGFAGLNLIFLMMIFLLIPWAYIFYRIEKNRKKAEQELHNIIDADPAFGLAVRRRIGEVIPYIPKTAP